VKLTANNTAVVLYLLAALATLGVWYVLLYMHNPPGANPIDNLRYFLNEPPSKAVFWRLLVLPVLCLVLAAAYFFKWSQTRRGAISLFGVGVALALAAWWSAPLPVAGLVSIALWYGFMVLRPHLTFHSTGTR
jgi:hypothetical protein